MRQLVFILLFFQFNCIAQNNNISKLTQHYRSISVDSLVVVYEKNYKENRDSIFKHIEKNYKPFNFKRQNPTLIIETYLSEQIESYCYSQDVSQYFNVALGSNNIAYLNSDNKLIALVQYSKSESSEEVSVMEFYKKKPIQII